MVSRRFAPPGCGLTHIVTHMRKGAERVGCGRKPPGGKLGGDSGGFCGERSGSVTGDYGRGQCGSRGGMVYDVGVFPALAVRGSLPSLR